MRKGYLALRDQEKKVYFTDVRRQFSNFPRQMEKVFQGYLYMWCKASLVETPLLGGSVIRINLAGFCVVWWEGGCCHLKNSFGGRQIKQPAGNNVGGLVEFSIVWIAATLKFEISRRIYGFSSYFASFLKEKLLDTCPKHWSKGQVNFGRESDDEFTLFLYELSYYMSTGLTCGLMSFDNLKYFSFHHTKLNMDVCVLFTLTQVQVVKPKFYKVTLCIIR